MENNTSKRLKTLLVIESAEFLTSNSEGVELEEGYEFSINSSIPQLADALAIFLSGLDKEPDETEGNTGEILLNLVIEYYNRRKEGDINAN